LKLALNNCEGRGSEGEEHQEIISVPLPSSSQREVSGDVTNAHSLEGRAGRDRMGLSLPAKSLRGDGGDGRGGVHHGERGADDRQRTFPALRSSHQPLVTPARYWTRNIPQRDVKEKRARVCGGGNYKLDGKAYTRPPRSEECVPRAGDLPATKSSGTTCPTRMRRGATVPKPTTRTLLPRTRAIRKGTVFAKKDHEVNKETTKQPGRVRGTYDRDGHENSRSNLLYFNIGRGEGVGCSLLCARWLYPRVSLLL